MLIEVKYEYSIKPENPKMTISSQDYGKPETKKDIIIDTPDANWKGKETVEVADGTSAHELTLKFTNYFKTTVQNTTSFRIKKMTRLPNPVKL